MAKTSRTAVPTAIMPVHVHVPCQYFFRWERLYKLTITLAPRFNIFWDVFLSAMYISGFLNKRSERLRFRTAFGGDCHLPAQNSSRRQVTSVLQGTKTGGRFNGTISGELLNFMV